MEPNNTITKYYQLLGECLVFYFFLVPTFAFSRLSLPFWNYLFILLVSIVLLSISIHYVKNYSIYLVDLLLLLFIIYILQFPLTSGILLVLFIMWRFVVHEVNANMQNQMKLIGLMLFAFACDVILFYDEKLIWMAVIFLFVLVVGHQLSHVFIESTSIYKALRFPFAYFILIVVGSVMVFSFFQFTNITLASLWNKLIALITSIPIFKPDIGVRSSPPKVETPVPEQDTATPQSDIPDVFTWLLLGIFIIVIVGIIVYLARKKVFQQGKLGKVNRFTSTSMKKIPEKQSKRKGMVKGFTKKPTNQIRLKVFRFEQLTNRKGIGRQHSETIEEWFKRYGIESTYLDLYQKIRYGNTELTEEEIERFNMQLSEIKEKMDL